MTDSTFSRVLQYQILQAWASCVGAAVASVARVPPLTAVRIGSRRNSDPVSAERHSSLLSLFRTVFRTGEPTPEYKFNSDGYTLVETDVAGRRMPGRHGTP